jgi:segregation and condensation protein B
MNVAELSAAAEAILFAAGDPLPLERLCMALSLQESELHSVLLHLKDQLEERNSGLCLLFMDNKAQLCTRPAYAEAIRLALETRKPPSLTQTALEVLSIVAYRQPVTKSFVERIRGVDSGYTLSSLADKGLIEEAGRLEVPGRPILYKTTDLFLRTFGISSLEELPPLPPDTVGQLPLMPTEESAG